MRGPNPVRAGCVNEESLGERDTANVDCVAPYLQLARDFHQFADELSESCLIVE